MPEDYTPPTEAELERWEEWAKPMVDTSGQQRADAVCILRLIRALREARKAVNAATAAIDSVGKEQE